MDSQVWAGNWECMPWSTTARPRTSTSRPILEMNTISMNQLEALASEGTVDTVLAVFPDQQGRLTGKRYTARTFLDQAWDAWEACDYLLGCDLENEPLTGYALFSWSHGYGDFVVRPDIGTLVVVPWLDRTAMVLG